MLIRNSAEMQPNKSWQPQYPYTHQIESGKTMDHRRKQNTKDFYTQFQGQISTWKTTER